MKANELKPGKALNLDGQVWLCVNTENVKPGKGGAFVQAKLKNLQSGNNVEKRYRSTDEVEDVILDRREVEFLYQDAGGAVFMDPENFEQFTIAQDVLGEALLYTRPNETIKGLFHNDVCLAVELPANVELEVTDTPPGIKNATATNQLKEAICETGLKTKVPPFVNIGDKVRLSTATGEYQSRA